MQRGVLLAGAAGAASVAGWAGLERALAAGGVLTAERQATYAALVEAVALADSSKVSAKNLDGTVADFADFYADAPEVVRASANKALDRVGRMPGGGRFAELDTRARLARVRSAYRGERVDADWRGALATAVEFVSVPFYPSPADRPAYIRL